jgi:hypothetical protein
MATRKNGKANKSKKPTTNGSRANGSRRNAGYGAINLKTEDLAKNMEESADQRSGHPDKRQSKLTQGG